MIQHNAEDQHVKRLVSEAMARIQGEKYKKDLGKLETMLVYGVAKSKNIDLVVNRDFKNSAKLLKLIDSKASHLVVHTEDFGTLEWARDKRIGLGYNLRANHAELCKKIIIASYLCLNDLISFEA